MAFDTLFMPGPSFSPLFQFSYIANLYLSIHILNYTHLRWCRCERQKKIRCFFLDRKKIFYFQIISIFQNSKNSRNNSIFPLFLEKWQNSFYTLFLPCLYKLVICTPLPLPRGTHYLNLMAKLYTGNDDLIHKHVLFSSLVLY